MGSTMTTSSGHVSILRSQSPEKDASVLMKLLPGFQREDISPTDSTVLVSGGTSLYLVPAEKRDKGDPAVLVLPTDLIAQINRKCQEAQVTVSISSNEMILRIHLPGGPTLLLVAHNVVSSSEGREELAKAVATSEGFFSAPRDSVKDQYDYYVETESDETFDDIDMNGKAIMEAETEPVETKPSVDLFPSLAISLLDQQGQMQPTSLANSPRPVPVETKLFSGKMMLVMRPQDPETDPYWNDKIFSKRKRRFIFQLQGRFKYDPKGMIFAGAEVTDPMKLGLIAKGLSGILLKLVKSFSGDVHYSFGDVKNKAHIVIPAWTFFERLVVTNAGETPPALGEEFEESQESIAARRAGKTKPSWNSQDTYSMSFYSMYLDLPTWQIVNVPVTRDVDLQTFWGNSLLRIVMYEKTNREDFHLYQSNRYAFTIQMEFLGLDPNTQQDGSNNFPWEKKRRPRPLEKTDRQESGTFLVEEAEGEDYLFFDAEEENSSGEIDESEVPVESPHPIDPFKLLSRIDTLCPAWIEMIQNGRYVKVYSISLSAESRPVFRTYSDCEAFFDTEEAKELAEELWSHRMSSSEKSRRVLGRAVSQAEQSLSSASITRMNAFKRLETDYDRTFLRRSAPSFSPRLGSQPQKAGYVARALSDRHWIEEWAMITDQYIAFFNPEKKKPHFRVNMHNISHVQKLLEQDAPFLPTFSFMEIETLGRTVYLMFPSESTCDSWLNVLSTLVAEHRDGTGKHSSGSCWKDSDDSNQLMNVDDPSDEFLHKSSIWNCKQRRVLNCRRFSFRSQYPETHDPHSLVQDALVRALEPMENSEEINLRAFLDSAAVLKEVNVYGMNEKERLAFFLNLYHVMIMHAFLVLGPPHSSFKWISYFNSISYQCSDDIFSLTELEHCIIRAAMNYPSQFVSRFVLPKSQYRFALTQPDYRINFALNCGSLSNPEVIPLYKATMLDQQLDDATRLYLNCSVEIEAKRTGTIIMTLPRVCQWFADDFGNGSTNSILLKLQRFLDNEKQIMLARCFSDKDKRFNFHDLQVKHHSYSFECRHLRLLETESPFRIDEE